MVSLPDLDWYFLRSLLCVLCCFILLRHGTILCVNCILLCCTVHVTYCSVFFFLLCMYCFVFDCIYRTLTLLPGLNPVAVNKYLSICISTYLIFRGCTLIRLEYLWSFGYSDKAERIVTVIEAKGVVFNQGTPAIVIVSRPPAYLFR
jgi:hypothetical protein